MDSDSRTATEKQLEETLEETFPASDAPANTLEMGIRVNAGLQSRSGLVVSDNRDARRFEVVVDGGVAYLEYQRPRDAFVIVHTEVPESARGRGVGRLLAQTALEAAR